MFKRWRWLSPVLVLAAVTAVWAATQMQSVQVRTGKLREKPSFLGKVVSRVAYGDRLETLESRMGWTRVRDDEGHSGWIHASALTEKTIVLSAGDAPVATGASGEEIALAGKGFNEEVETAFKTANPAIDYTWVDRMESFRITPRDAAAFLATGRVEPKGGESS